MFRAKYVIFASMLILISQLSANANAINMMEVPTVEAVQVDAGDYHSCALFVDGSVWCWGSNYYGQLGNGTRENSDVPVQVVGLPPIKTIRLFAEISCALDVDGFIWCWGESGDGELLQGDAYEVDGQTCVDPLGRPFTCHNHAKLLWQTTPLKVPHVQDIVNFDVGPYTICAINTLQQLLCWGDPYTVGVNPQSLWNGTLPLGNHDNPSNYFSTYYEPFYIDSLSGVAQVSVGGRTGTCALLVNGTIWCFPLGPWAASSTTYEPMQIEGISNAVLVSAESYFGSCAILENSEVHCWDGNQSIFGLDISGMTPTRINALEGVTDIRSSQLIGCGKRPNQNWVCWGSNYAGAISPAIADFMPITEIPNSTEFLDFGVGWVGHICAVAISGGISCWGADDKGQLGDGPAITSSGASLETVSVDTVRGAVEDLSATSCGKDASDTIYCDVVTSVSTTSTSGWRSIAFGQPRTVTDLLPGLSFTESPNPILSGDFSPGKTIKATVGKWSPVPQTLTFKWLRNGLVIPGATKTTYKVLKTDIGNNISFSVTAERSGYKVTSKTSSSELVLDKFTSSPTPTISGSTRVGSTLSVKVGTWKPTPDVISIQWYANNQLIVGATNSKYKLTSSEKGKAITVKVTATKLNFRETVMSSKPTKKIT